MATKKIGNVKGSDATVTTANITKALGYTPAKEDDVSAMKTNIAGKEPAGTAVQKVSEHNVDETSHNDLRVLLTNLREAVLKFLDVDDEKVDQLSEVLAGIDANTDLITALTSSKVNVKDIVNNLETNLANVPLSAAQGVVLKGLYDVLDAAIKNIIIPTELPASDVYDWAKEEEKPEYTADEVGARPNTWTPSATDVGADPAGTAASEVSEHNTNDAAHNDIRVVLQELKTAFNNFMDMSEEEWNQASELVAAIKANKATVEELTTNKVSTSDIINNLTTNLSTKVLSAAQGVAMKALIDVLQKLFDTHKGDTTAHITAAERTAWNSKQPAGNYATKEELPTKTSQLTDDVGFAKQTDLEKQAEEIADLKSGSVSIPDYWKTHLDEKIALIKEAQDKGGKDAVSYIVITDMHYPSNLGKIAPLLAKYIMDRCDIKFVLILGDTRNRGLHATKEACETEWNNIDEMLKPLQGKILMTQGNHDSGYGTGDYDGDGDNDTFAYEFTPAEMFNRVYRKAGMAGDVHYDASGTAFYIDDESNKTRYILLNTQLNFDGNAGYDSYENVNGMAKYPSMWIFRYTQCQYDFLINNALATVPNDDWKVVMGSHIPINQSGEMPEYAVMVGVLNAYNNKTTYSGEYAGTAEGGSSSTPNFTNLNDTSDENFMDNYKLSNNNPIASDGDFISAYIPAQCANKNADIIRVAGIDTSKQIGMNSYDANYTLLTNATTAAYNDITWDENGIVTWKAGYVNNYISTSSANNLRYIRITGTKLSTAEDIVITVNEEITYTESAGGAGYDAVAVDCDFTTAKGNLIAYHGGHVHKDIVDTTCYPSGALSFPVIMTRCDAAEENDSILKAERVAGTTTEQSFDVFTVTPDKIYATKIGAGSDREIAL